MLLLDVGEERGVAEVGLAAGALVVPGLDADGQVLVVGVLFLHVMFFGQTIINKKGKLVNLYWLLIISYKIVILALITDSFFLSFSPRTEETPKILSLPITSRPGHSPTRRNTGSIKITEVGRLPH